MSTRQSYYYYPTLAAIVLLALCSSRHTLIPSVQACDSGLAIGGRDAVGPAGLLLSPRRSAAGLLVNHDHDDHDFQLLRRSPQGGITLGSSSSSSSAISTSSSSPPATVGNPTSPTASSSSSLPPGYAMPQAFDAVLGVNFTSTSCPSFFTRFLADSAFKACAPLSFLLETSTTFFKAMQDGTVLPAVMDRICSADVDTCQGVMDKYSRLINQPGNCGPDLDQGNALAVSALNGFKNYKLFFEAGCLKNTKTQRYCFAEAANATTPNDLYIYYLPGGTSLPSGEKPTCDKCSQNVMNTFSNYASNSSMRISETYVNARNVISLSCGPSFAPMVAATTSPGAATQNILASRTVVVAIAVLLAGLFVLQ